MPVHVLHHPHCVSRHQLRSGPLDDRIFSDSTNDCMTVSKPKYWKMSLASLVMDKYGKRHLPIFGLGLRRMRALRVKTGEKAELRFLCHSMFDPLRSHLQPVPVYAIRSPSSIYPPPDGPAQDFSQRWKEGATKIEI